MVTKIEIENWRTKAVIFSYECEKNTYKKTVEAAVKQGVSLEYANLISVNLRYADLRNADLRNAMLSNAFLFKAKLNDADLRNAILVGANLTKANLENADLRWANLDNAILHESNFNNATLFWANLNEAKFIGANLSNANLMNANLYLSILGSANLDGAMINYPLNLPEGEFIAWKKVREDLSYIIKLKVLADSKRSRATSDKCRCDKALVLEIQDLDGNKLDLVKVVNTNLYARCVYKVGEIVYADSWDENRWIECSHGIHFFLDRQKAVEY